MKSLLAAFLITLSASALAHPINNPPAYYEGKVVSSTIPDNSACGMFTKALKNGEVELKVNAFGITSSRMIVPNGTISLTLSAYTEIKPFFPMTVHATLVDGKPVSFYAEVDVHGDIEKLNCEF